MSSIDNSNMSCIQILKLNMRVFILMIWLVLSILMLSKCINGKATTTASIHHSSTTTTTLAAYIASNTQRNNHHRILSLDFSAFLRLQKQQQKRINHRKTFNNFNNNERILLRTKRQVAIDTSSVTSSTLETEMINDKNYDNENSIDDVFPPPLSGTDRLIRASTFWMTSIPIILNYYQLILNIEIRELIQQPYNDNEKEIMWNEMHMDGATKLKNVIEELKGFYVKTAQIISSRLDLFPVEYTDALSGFTDNLDPMSYPIVKAIIKNELLHANETFSDIFIEFDPIPLGAASVAQVHRAILSKQYGGPREVAVKIQRPSIESKLLGDISNLKAISKFFRSILPLDYYTVFCELEVQLQDEFDFVKEAVAMERIYNCVSFDPITRSPRDVPLIIPKPIPGLINKRVFVQEYLSGIPLSRLKEQMIKNGIDPNSIEAKLFGKKLLTSLTEVFGRTILETGFFHADPHPGNIFVLDNGQIGLIDFGQVKQISGRNRETLCKVMIALDERSDDILSDMDRVGDLALELGVELRDDAPREAAAAVGIWLFDGTVEQLPGGYDKGELSPNSPVKELKSFPQDLVLVGRSSILIKGLSDRLDIPWSLAKQWAPIARKVLSESYQPESFHAINSDNLSRIRFRDVIFTFKQWGKGRATRVFTKLPKSAQKRIATLIYKYDERRTNRQLKNSNKTKR